MLSVPNGMVLQLYPVCPASCPRMTSSSPHVACLRDSTQPLRYPCGPGGVMALTPREPVGTCSPLLDLQWVILHNTSKGLGGTDPKFSFKVTSSRTHPWIGFLSFLFYSASSLTSLPKISHLSPAQLLAETLGKAPLKQCLEQVWPKCALLHLGGGSLPAAVWFQVRKSNMNHQIYQVPAIHITENFCALTLSDQNA